MNSQTQSFFIQGAAGQLQCALDLPTTDPIGIALVAHPHPLYGGTMDNKVAQTLARTFIGMGYVTARMNFRGVGQSAGEHDNGIGETADMLLLLNHIQQKYPHLPFALSGFSFGTFVQSRLERELPADNKPQRLVFIGSAAVKWDLGVVPSDTIIVHGEQDETIPLSDVLDWARPQDLPVTVIPGADHFFHRKLHHIKQLVTALW